jgi:hypothetical protein
MARNGTVGGSLAPPFAVGTSGFGQFNLEVRRERLKLGSKDVLKSKKPLRRPN